MTRVDTLQVDNKVLVSSDANFISNTFPSYTIGANNVIIEAKSGARAPPLKDVVAMETIKLLEQQKRLSVRDLAEKFEKGLATAAQLSDEARCKDVTSLDKHVLLKKLRDSLESLKGRIAGRNKDDAEEAISMVEALAVQLTQREGELIQEKSEIKRLAIFLKQATEDAKKVVEEERAIAHAEIESARDAVSRVMQTLKERELLSADPEKQSLEEMKKEVQEARRIKMLHQPSKVMDMEHELRALRVQLKEKTMYAIQLRKQLGMAKGSEENKCNFYELDGSESLGCCLQVITTDDSAPHISNCSIQWFRMLGDGSRRELISGATKPVYAPEPFDVGKILQVDINLEDQKVTLETTGPIDPAPGLGSYVEALVSSSDTKFNVVIINDDGRDSTSTSIHVLYVGKMRIKLCKGNTTKAKESYSTSMQLCGVRGGGNAASKSLFWQVRRGLSYTLAFESERDRNAAIMLARRFAFYCNISLAGPDERRP